MSKIENIAILGAGLVGSLLSIYLAKKGYQVTIYEKRPDMRKSTVDGGRSINLALSHRGLKPLETVGLGDVIRENCIPMPGRMIHDNKGELNFQPYGKEGQYINSISRGGLNALLMSKAEEEGVIIQFNHWCKKVDLQDTSADFDLNGEQKTVHADMIIGADGAFSALRAAFQITDRFDYSQHYITAGYKELCIPPTAEGGFALDPNALHIWPRGQYMLIALPNLDKSFTCTLFFPFEGKPSFDTLKSEQDVTQFFEQTFPDAVPLMPTLAQDFFGNPTSSLVTVRCYPWVKENTLLIGDAAHAIVPFYGQGMNCGFEDCYVFDQLLESHGEISPNMLQDFQQLRKPDADAIADLALYNFIEMRDKVADEKFLLQKKIEAKLHALYPDRWTPLYAMVTFSDLRYSEAYTIGKKQQAIMDDLLANTPDVENRWESLDFQSIVERLK